MSEESSQATEWESHTDEDGDVYHTLPGIVDKYGRPTRYRERTGHSPRASRRALGIRTPLAALEAWQDAMNQAWAELLNEGTQEDTLEKEQ